MRYIVSAIIGLSLINCAHSGPVAQTPENPSTIYAFESFEAQRSVNAEPAKDKKKPKAAKTQAPEKFVAVFPCQKGQKCQPQEQEKKVVPYTAFAETVKKNAVKSQDVLGRQERILVRGVASLKKEKSLMQQEHAYFDKQIEMHRYSSLRPVVDNFRRAKVQIEKEIAYFDQKIQQFEKDLNYLKNPGGMQLGMDDSTGKLLKMLEDGQWGTFGAYLDKNDQVLWNFFQEVGQDVAKN